MKQVLNAAEKSYKRLHKNGDYEAKDITEYRELIDATHEVFTKALSNGIADNVIPRAMKQSLEEDVFVFSALKTHAQLFEASRQLLDSEGKVKSFQTFNHDIKQIKASYNENYLYAEYNFATASAQQAANWSQVEEGKGRYNLQYRTAQDDRVRDDHAEMHGITLPIDDDFWDKYYPPNGWNCRCVAIEVLKDDYKVSNSEEANSKGDTATTKIGKNGKNKLEIFRFNPGKEKVVFPPNHPYRKLQGSKAVAEATEKIQTQEDYKILDRVEIVTYNIENLPDEIKNAYPDIDIEKVNAVNMYSDTYYAEINKFNRGLDVEMYPEHGIDEKFWQTLTKVINQGLDEIPDKFEGMAYRGTNLTAKQVEKYKNALKATGIIEEPAFTSSSYVKEEAFDGNVRFSIKSKNGTIIEKVSSVKREKEVLFKAGQKFKVTDFKEYDGNVYDIYMEEV